MRVTSGGAATPFWQAAADSKRHHFVQEIVFVTSLSYTVACCLSSLQAGLSHAC